MIIKPAPRRHVHPQTLHRPQKSLRIPNPPQHRHPPPPLERPPRRILHPSPSPTPSAPSFPLPSRPPATPSPFTTTGTPGHSCSITITSSLFPRPPPGSFGAPYPRVSTAGFRPIFCSSFASI